MYLSFINVIILHSDRRHVSVTHVAIFRVVSARIQIYIYSVPSCFHQQIGLLVKEETGEVLHLEHGFMWC